MNDEDTLAQEDREVAEPLVLGQQLADAHNAERQRLESGDFAESPLPDAEYDFWRGDFSLVAPAQSPLDEDIRLVCSQYALADPEQRSTMRRSIDMDQLYTLIYFAKRTAVFGVRQGKPEVVAHGLTAIAMIEQERVDYRDILWCLGLLYHSAKRAGGDADAMFQSAAALAEPDVARFFLNFVEQDAGYRDLRSSWGYDEVQTKDGIGFVGWGSEAYKPTIDMKSTIIDISELVANESYQPGQIEAATDLPDVWVGGQGNPQTQNLLSTVRAGATMHARLRPDKHAQNASQQFTVFLVEVESEEDAQALCQLAEATTTPTHSTLAMARGKLLCVVVARSIMEGVDSFETNESLARFSTGLVDVLEQHSDSTRK